MNNYEINKNTIALLEAGERTQVIEEDNIFYVNNTPNKIMENSCEYFGSSLSGRQKGTISLTGISHKSPIIVEEESLMIFFPTTSPRLKNCSWISTKKIKRYYKNNDSVVIEYNNGQKISLNISYGIIDNQILRSALLEKNMISRKNEQKKV
ncbi:MAG: competence protein ComK [Bacilli bacterium]|nr:competence protein ComK [Bacilli bacterium]